MMKKKVFAIPIIIGIILFVEYSCKKEAKDQLPSVKTTTVSSITKISAQIGGNVTSDGGAIVTAYGVCWGNSVNPTIENSKTSDGTGTGIFTSTITDLTIETTYYLRAYATNSVGTGYGNVVTFSTLPCSPPILTTSAVKDITKYSATSGGNITSDDGVSVLTRGVCWSTLTNPSIALATITNDGSGIGTFISSITGLSVNTTYYIKSYATTSKGTVYGNEISFKTSPPTIPVLNTIVVASIGGTTARSGGNITNDGGAPIMNRGVCWGINQNPTIGNGNESSSGAGTGVYTSPIMNLAPNTTYYLRAYATNSVGIAYGNEVNFTTKPTSDLAIGQSYQGGIIAYFLMPGDPNFITGETHGLIIAAMDQSTGAPWGCESTPIASANGLTLGTGYQNTINIIAECPTPGIAAKICYDLELEGYTDWYLPSRDELQLIYLNRSRIGGFSDDSYWTSSQSSTWAYYQEFTCPEGINGCCGIYYKSYNFSVRAIRSF